MENSTTARTTYVRYSGGLCWLDGPESTQTYAVVLILLAIVSTFENLVVIIAIYKYEVLRTTSIILLGVLATIDLITGAIVTPIKVWITLNRYHGDILSTFLWLFMSVVFFSLSTVLMISLDRFFQVYFLEKYRMTKTKLTIGLLSVWIIPVLLLICMVCGYYNIAVFWIAFAYFLFCIVAMIVSYIGMFVCLRKHTRNAGGETRLNYIENQRRAVKTTLIIIATCIVMNVFPVVFTALGIAGIFSRVLCAMAFFALLANSAVNPVIYCLRIPVMKKYILKLLRIQRFMEETVDEGEDAFLTVVADTNIEMESR